MGERMHRAQILMEPEQHQALARIAGQEGRSISALVREIIRDWLSGQEGELLWERRMEAMERLRRIRAEVEERHGVYLGDLVKEARGEREENTERVWRR